MGGNRLIVEGAQSRNKFFLSLFTVYVGVALLFGLLLDRSRLLDRQELQTINKRFEARQWLAWSPESLKRLNLPLLWEYHEQHEIPRTWWAWDYTLSWLLENNHPPVQNDVVIFNRTLEDEPPDAAIRQFPWMEPLQHYPLPRATVANMVDFLAASGAGCIILDNDFPQHSAGDRELAEVIHKWSTVGVKGRKVPVLMVGTVNTASKGHVVEMGVPTTPAGIISELKRLEPGVDVEAKYLGMTCVQEDNDQVIRNIILKWRVADREYRSVVLKALECMHQPIPADVPDTIDVDFACPPNSELYPIRPLTYLLDPEQRKEMLNPGKISADVDVRGSIVFIGDGVTDVYSTPFTNEGLNKMSGTEILAQALDTVSRHSWPHRLSGLESLLYLLLSSVIGGTVWIVWKGLQHSTSVSQKESRSLSLARLFADISVFVLLITGSYFVACLFFAFKGLIVPVFVPSMALAFGTLSAILWEREREREETFSVKLAAAQEKLILTKDKYEAELRQKEAEAKNREMLVDRKRRHEFVRRINHDLNAPVSVLNWTVAELQMMDLESQQAVEKVARLVKSSDKLCELIDQLVQSYDYENAPDEAGAQAVIADLVSVVHDSVDGQQPLAAMHEDRLVWTKPGQSLWVKANQLELTRVVDNIIRNAIKHNPKGTVVTVTLEPAGAFHIVTIADNGKGIAPEHLSRIFEPGYRVEPGNKDGQGLGLDIARTLIEGMGGEITVESALKKGTTFKLRLPVCSAPGEDAGGGTAGDIDGGDTNEDAPENTENVFTGVKTESAACSQSEGDADRETSAAVLTKERLADVLQRAKDGNGNPNGSGEDHD